MFLSLSVKLAWQLLTAITTLAKWVSHLEDAVGLKYRSQVTSHRSLFYQYRKYAKHLQKLTLGLKISV